jgi:hypothetical protein
MKIRWDFVTNSSSTSFLVICTGRPKRKDFMAAMGVKKRSPLSGIFGELYEAILDNIHPLAEAEKLGRWRNASSAYDFVRKEFSERTAKRVASATKAGKSVWIGSLSSDNGGAEGFFCCESFEADYRDFYINGLPCAW